MSPRQNLHVDIPSALDPTDDRFDDMYLSMLELMSYQATSAVSGNPSIDYGVEAASVEISNERTTVEKPQSMSPDIFRAVQNWNSRTWPA